jgi:hypothetical protein
VCVWEEKDEKFLSFFLDTHEILHFPPPQLIFLPFFAAFFVATIICCFLWWLTIYKYIFSSSDKTTRRKSQYQQKYIMYLCVYNENCFVEKYYIRGRGRGINFFFSTKVELLNFLFYSFTRISISVCACVRVWRRLITWNIFRYTSWTNVCAKSIHENRFISWKCAFVEIIAKEFKEYENFLTPTHTCFWKVQEQKEVCENLFIENCYGKQK